MLCSQRVVLTLFVAAAMSIFSVAHAQCVGCGNASGPAVAPVYSSGPAVYSSGPAVAAYSSPSPCASGNCGGGCGGGFADGGFSGGGFAGGDGFGYAGGGCPGGNCGGGAGGGCIGGNCLANAKAGRADIAYQWDQIRHQSEKTRARNAAWMKPFACADRQAYEAIFARQFQAGLVQACTLTDNHFDSQTGDLNGLGRAMVQGVMKNSPDGQKQIFVYNGRGEVDYDSKIRSVNSLINDYYGQGLAQVAATSTYPKSGSGIRNETQNDLFVEGTPPPVITIPTGTGSTSDTQAAN